MMRLPKTFLKGSIPPLITPFRNGKVDYDAYAGLVEFQVKHQLGVQTLSIANSAPNILLGLFQ